MFKTTVTISCMVVGQLADKHIYTPGIYADGYIVFAFPFVCSLVQLKCQSFG